MVKGTGGKGVECKTKLPLKASYDHPLDDGDKEESYYPTTQFHFTVRVMEV